MAVASLFGMGAALLFLAYAAGTAPATANKASNRRVGALPEGSEPRRIGGRIATFLIVVLVAMIVSVGLALTARGLVAWSGAGDANANVASFFVMPLAWTLLAFAVLMEERRAKQWRLLAMSAVPGVVAVIIGVAA
jgi:phosphoglycerol transferase MdoB-like AlkP superfamily enzyme